MRAWQSAVIGAALAIGASACAAHTAPVAGTPAPAYAACTEEDGSAPGQAFPCAWDATTRGNGQGESYVLTGPVCSAYEVALADASHARGYDLHLACDDLESLVGAN